MIWFQIQNPFLIPSKVSVTPRASAATIGSPCFNPFQSQVWRWPGSLSAFPATVHWPDILFWRSPHGHRRTASVNVTQERNDQENMSSYCCTSWLAITLATPETVPVNSPAAAKNTGV